MNYAQKIAYHPEIMIFLKVLHPQYYDQFVLRVNPTWCLSQYESCLVLIYLYIKFQHLSNFHFGAI